MWVVGPKNVVFSSAQLDPASSRQIVAQLKTGFVTRPEARAVFVRLQARFAEIKARLGGHASEISPEVSQFRRDLMAELVALNVELRWPVPGRKGGRIEDETRALLLMLMGLSMGRMFRSQLPAAMQTLPSLDAGPDAVQDLHDHVLPFVLVEPQEPEYRWALAQGMLADLIVATVDPKHPISFALRQNFDWNPVARTAKAVFTFPSELRSFSPSLASGLGLTLGRVPAAAEAKEGLCESCFEQNSPDSAEAADIVDSLNFAVSARAMRDVADLLRLAKSQVSKSLGVLPNATPAEKAAVAALAAELEKERPGQAFGTRATDVFPNIPSLPVLVTSSSPPPPPPPPKASLQNEIEELKNDASAAAELFAREAPPDAHRLVHELVHSKPSDQMPALQGSQFAGKVAQAIQDGTWILGARKPVFEDVLGYAIQMAPFANAPVAFAASVQAWFQLFQHPRTAQDPKLLQDVLQARLVEPTLVFTLPQPYTVFASSMNQARASLVFLRAYRALSDAFASPANNPSELTRRHQVLLDLPNLQAMPDSDEFCIPADQDKLLVWFLVAGLSLALHPAIDADSAPVQTLFRRKESLKAATVLDFTPSQPPTAQQAVLLQAREAANPAELLQVFTESRDLVLEGSCIVDSTEAAQVREAVAEASEVTLLDPASFSLVSELAQVPRNHGDFGTLVNVWEASKDTFDFAEVGYRDVVENFIRAGQYSERGFDETLTVLLSSTPSEHIDEGFVGMSRSTLKQELSKLALVLRANVYTRPVQVALPLPDLPAILPLVTDGQDARLFVYTLMKFWRASSSRWPALAVDRLLADVHAGVPASAHCSPFDTDASMGLALLFALAISSRSTLPGVTTKLQPERLAEMLARPDLLPEQRTFLGQLQAAAPDEIQAQAQVVRSWLSTMQADFGAFDFGPCLLSGHVPANLRVDEAYRYVLYQERLVLETDPARQNFGPEFYQLQEQFETSPSIELHRRLLNLEQVRRYSFSEYVSIVNRQLRRMKALDTVEFSTKPMAPVVVNAEQGKLVVELTRKLSAPDLLALPVPTRSDEVAQLLRVPFGLCASERDEFAAMLATQLFCLVLQADAHRFDPEWGNQVLHNLKTFQHALPADAAGFFEAAGKAKTPSELFGVVNSHEFPSWTPCQ